MEDDKKEHGLRSCYEHLSNFLFDSATFLPIDALVRMISLVRGMTAVEWSLVLRWLLFAPLNGGVCHVMRDVVNL